MGEAGRLWSYGTPPLTHWCVRRRQIPRPKPGTLSRVAVQGPPVLRVRAIPPGITSLVPASPAYPGLLLVPDTPRVYLIATGLSG